MTNWVKNNEIARKIERHNGVLGWENKKTGEIIVCTKQDQEYATLHFAYTEGDKELRGKNKTLLFRTKTPNVAHKLEPYFGTKDQREFLNSESIEPKPIDTVLIRRNELQDPRKLGEWAHINNASYFQGEKIGNRKESSGKVAFFDGSTRWGKGAYIALASEYGPRGREFTSIGYKSDDYYTVETQNVSNVSQEPLEIENPTDVTFTRDQITIENEEGQRIVVKSQ
jgi:hypothetical protein